MTNLEQAVNDLADSARRAHATALELRDESQREIDIKLRQIAFVIRFWRTAAICGWFGFVVSIAMRWM